MRDFCKTVRGKAVVAVGAEGQDEAPGGTGTFSTLRFCVGGSVTAASCSKVSSEIYVMHICILSIFILFWGEKINLMTRGMSYIQVNSGSGRVKKSEQKDNCKTPRTQRTLGKGGQDE